MVNLFFNANYYLANNSDLVAAGLHTPEQLWEHYITYGAQERADLLEVGTIDQTSHLRQANDWFNAGYYLATYPDLVAADITAAQALDHYYQYGINESRSFSPNPALQPNEFNAETYAEYNPDVREHYGIKENAELTAQDKANLLKHYLAYGFSEGRDGAGKTFTEALEAGNFNITHVAVDKAGLGAKNVVGTLANDEFVVDQDTNLEATLESWYIDGAGGNNSVIFKAAADELTLRNIQSITVDSANDITARITTELDALTLKNAGNVNLTFAAASGTADALNVEVVSMASESSVLTLNGLEKVNVSFDDKFTAEEFILHANHSQGADQLITLTGGSAFDDVGLNLVFENQGSPDLTNLTIDATSLKTGLTPSVYLDGQASNVSNITIKGSKTAENALSIFTDEPLTTDQLVTLIGGDNADTLNASTAIDIMTGGLGNNVFTFTPSLNETTAKIENGKITAIDTITDFKKGDSLDIEDILFEEVDPATGTKTLENILLTGGENGAPLSAGSFFNFGNDAYIVTVAASVDADNLLDSVGLIKLAGVHVHADDGYIAPL